MTRGLSNLRKTSKAAGDDCTLTRWVKTPGRGHSKHPTAPMPFDATGTRFPKTVMRPGDRSVLISGHNSTKIGRDVRKGHLRGYWVYTLTLEERATCPITCLHWQDCYGNSSPFANRWAHGAALMVAIERDIIRLLSVRGRKGILIRLHALGDFYSVGYVKFWQRMLQEHPRLSVYGYTAREIDTPIGQELLRTMYSFGQRFAVRWSDGGGLTNCTVSIGDATECPPDAFVCPEQTGRTKVCSTCAACWSTQKNVAFIAH